MHYKWKNSFIGTEISNLGFPAVEIDESGAIIGNNHHIY